MRKVISLLLLLMMSIPGAGLGLPQAALAQGDCGDLAPRLSVGGYGWVTFTNGLPLNVRETPSRTGPRLAQLPEGTGFLALEGPVCADGLAWWRVQAGLTTGWIAEGADGEYFVEPLQATPTAVPAPLPTKPPATGEGPLSPINPAAAFVAWDWAAFLQEISWASNIPDPKTIAPPPAYAGDMPAPPIDLSAVRFVEDAGLTDTQLALLARNGFVVVPGGLRQFHEAYREDDVWITIPPDFNWENPPENLDVGHAFFVTTDAMLHALHYIFDNLLTDLEKATFYEQAHTVVVASLQAAHDQAGQLVDTPLARPASNAELYLAVALELLAPGEMPAMVTGGVASEAQAIVPLALAGEGQIPLPFLEGYIEDFSQYRPRGHYDGDELLERYFRGMMWLSRITFRANSDIETQTALLLLRALRSAPPAAQSWQTLHDTLSFLIGPVDDLGPPEYGPLADAIFGTDLDPAALGDAQRLAAFRAQLAELPGPRVNGLILSPDTTADQMAELTRGFRFLGQRFTFDAYVMQQLMYPYVGTPEERRLLPLALDVPAAFGSDLAYNLAAEAGATAYAHYDTQVAALRQELAALSDADYLENIYGGWLWTLQPLWVRDPASYPPMMQTEAWLRRDLQAGLGSWTELKHDTVLYAKQPSGLGGGGMPVLTSYGYVEPNPLVFARIAVVAATTYQGLVGRGLVEPFASVEDSAAFLLSTDALELRELAYRAASFAEMARKELAGEPLTEDEYWSIVTFGQYLEVLLISLFSGPGEPDPVALVTDVANDGAALVLQEAVGEVDYIYVVAPSSRGEWQVVRGGVFSYYEFVGDINRRMTDDEWRALVETGDLPPRPAWVSAFYSQ